MKPSGNNSLRLRQLILCIVFNKVCDICCRGQVQIVSVPSDVYIDVHVLQPVTRLTSSRYRRVQPSQRHSKIPLFCSNAVDIIILSNPLCADNRAADIIAATTPNSPSNLRAESTWRPGWRRLAKLEGASSTFINFERWCYIQGC